MMKSKPILIDNVFIDGHRLKLRRKTHLSMLEPMRELLREKYKAKTVYFNYRERVK